MKKTESKLKEKKFNRFDLPAIILISGVFCYCFYFASHGFGSTDESFYYTIVQRMEHADRLFVDEWYLSQLSTFISIIPYKIACLICSGTNGIILCMRYMYLISKIPIACFMWTKLRKYEFFGLMCEIIYLTYTDFDITSTFGYYSAAADGMIVVCFIMFLSEKLTPAKTVFAGFVFACAVLAEPFSVFLYIIYTVAAAIYSLNKKRRPHSVDASCFISAKTWLFFTCGCVLCAVPFFAVFLRNTDIKKIIENLPELTSSPDYTILSDYDGNFRLVRKIKQICDLGGAPATAAAAAVAAAIPVFAALIKNRKSRRIFRYAAVGAGALANAVIFAVMISKYQLDREVSIFFYAPYQLLALTFYLLCDKKHKPALLFLTAGILYSACIDTCSQVLYGYGGFLCQISFWLSAHTLVKELIAEKRSAGITERYTKTGAPAALLSCCAVILSVSVWQATFIRTQVFAPGAETVNAPVKISELNAVIETGPQKGLKTTQRVKDALSLMYTDVDGITKKSGAPFYVYERYTYLYLYANADYACYSAWTSEQFAIQIRYWTLFPERVPEYIYVPYYDYDAFTPLPDERIKAYISEIDDYFSFETLEGNGGYILKIKEVKF
ncbi:MAG: hypothetical protein IJS90_04705 [Clostridia bacterium]|nr:hypothetical protein [Clostridia bacterium]